MVQVSNCPNSFTSQCVFATNYEWGINVKAQRNITWRLSANETAAIYFRIMAGNVPVEFSMELSFTNDVEPFSYPWGSDLPFSGSRMNGFPTLLKIFIFAVLFTCN